VIDPTPLWDFDDPAASEQRFREAASSAEPDDRLVLLTQVARALGMQERYDEAHAVLDDLDTDSAPAEVAVRVDLERGRLLRSAGAPEAARPLFAAAERRATDEELDALRVDAIHMLALVAEPDERLAINEQALAIARQSPDPRAQNWDASLLNNIGMVHADNGDYEAALAAFEEALAARLRVGDVALIRIARWMVAWALRNLGQTDRALALQRELRAELEADGQVDPYVEEEIALLEA
jgi:tetratricopeptide (TPR) repeat protein